jgi:hypothetical protein
MLCEAVASGTQVKGSRCVWSTCLIAPACGFWLALHREKEAAKAAERTEKAAARTTKSATVSAPVGPPDDEDLEMDKLLAVSDGEEHKEGDTRAGQAALLRQHEMHNMACSL